MKVKVLAIMRDSVAGIPLAITDKNEIYYYADLVNGRQWRKFYHATTEDSLRHWQAQLRTGRPVTYGRLTIEVENPYRHSTALLNRAFQDLSKHLTDELKPGGSLHAFKR